MTTVQERQHDMLVRVREFGAAHPDGFPQGSAGAAALAAVGAAITQMEQAVSRHTGSHERVVAKAAAKAALRRRLIVLARTARAHAKTVVGFDSRFHVPAQQTDIALIAAARSFLISLPPVQDTFIRCGLPATFVADLEQATAAFEEAADKRLDGRMTGWDARAAVRYAVRQGMDAAALLDVVVANAFAGQPLVSDEWKTVRRVQWRNKPRPSVAVSRSPVNALRRVVSCAAIALAMVFGIGRQATAQPPMWSTADVPKMEVGVYGGLWDLEADGEVGFGGRVVFNRSEWLATEVSVEGQHANQWGPGRSAAIVSARAMTIGPDGPFYFATAGIAILNGDGSEISPVLGGGGQARWTGGLIAVRGEVQYFTRPVNRKQEKARVLVSIVVALR